MHMHYPHMHQQVRLVAHRPETGFQTTRERPVMDGTEVAFLLVLGDLQLLWA